MNHRRIMVPPRHRLTRPLTWRTLPIALSMAFVVARERRNRYYRSMPTTVSVSSSPSRTLAAAPGWGVSSRVASAVNVRVAASRAPSVLLLEEASEAQLERHGLAAANGHADGAGLEVPQDVEASPLVRRRVGDRDHPVVRIG